jgi:predicted DNA-binding transcriptional regulator AlpA
MPHHQPPAASSVNAVNDLLTVEQICKKFEISRTTLWRLRKNFGLPTTLLSASPRFLSHVVAEWLEKRTVTTKSALPSRRKSVRGRA